MFQIEEAPTGTTKCDWCGELIKKSTLRLRFAPQKGYNYYWHQDCGIKYAGIHQKKDIWHCQKLQYDR